MKKLLFSILFVLLLISCEKMDPYHEDGSEITAAEAVELMRPIIEQHCEDGRFFLISKTPIPARKLLKYGEFGEYNPASRFSGTFRSPNFKAWLIAFGPDRAINGSMHEQLHLFVDVKTGEYTEIYVEGLACDIEWDESFSQHANLDPSYWYPWLAEKEIRKANRIRSSSSEWTSDNSAWVVLTQGFADAYISEGPTSNPVNLWVSFLDPFGNTVVAGSQFN